MNYRLKVIDFSDDQVVLEDETKNIIYWPKEKLPAIPEIGQEIFFAINEQNKSQDPKELINELLKIDTN